MKMQLMLTMVVAGLVCSPASPEEHDFYRYLRYPAELVPGVGLDKVEQEGGPDAVGYRRRTVQWWPRRGQDIVDIPKGAPLRTWTRNKGQKDTEALAGVCRNWTTSDPETFKAHLIAFRSFGTSTTLPGPGHGPLIPAAVLRMENGEQRAVLDYGVISRMLGEEDHDFIHKVWKEAYPKLYATVSQGDLPMPGGGAPGGAYGDFDFTLWKAEQAKRALDREIQDGFKALPQSAEAEQEIKDLREKIGGITREIEKNSEVVKLAEDIRACEKRRGEVDREVRESAKLKAISVKVDAAGREKREAEERTRQLPELKRARELHEQEKDRQKKRGLQDTFKRLFEARRLTDPGWQKAEAAYQRLRRRHHETFRHEIQAHAGRKRAESRRSQLRGKLKDLTARLKETHPELPGLEESLRSKQGALGARRRQFEERGRSGADYKTAEAERAGAGKAVDDERKRIRREPVREVRELAARIEKLRKGSKVLLNNALKAARLFGKNPYPGGGAAELKRIQQEVIYHTTADWEHRTPEEVEGRAPPKMKRWLEEVRGY